MDALSSDKIHEIAVNTFEITCYMFPLEDWEITEIEDFDLPTDRVRSMVEFGGAAEGGMVIKPSKELLTGMAANMLGVETPTEEQEAGALCEIANIICGNTVPLFAHDENICHIHPPRLVVPAEDIDRTFQGMAKESIQIFLDEGMADITFYYSIEEEK